MVFLCVTTKKESQHNHLSSTLSCKEDKQISHNHEISKKKNILLIERERERESMDCKRKNGFLLPGFKLPQHLFSNPKEKEGFLGFIIIKKRRKGSLCFIISEETLFSF